MNIFLDVAIDRMESIKMRKCVVSAMASVNYYKAFRKYNLNQNKKFSGFSVEGCLLVGGLFFTSCASLPTSNLMVL